jgi:hypothetical protein
VAPDCPSYVVPPFDFEARIVTARLPGWPWPRSTSRTGQGLRGQAALLGDLEAFAAAHARDGVPLVICGDLNGHADADIHPKERKLNQIGARPSARSSSA